MFYLFKNILSCIYFCFNKKKFSRKYRVLLSCYTSMQCTYIEYNFKKSGLKYKILTKNLGNKIHCNHIITRNVIKPCICVYARKNNNNKT